jgi:hypothetical protein
MKKNFHSAVMAMRRREGNQHQKWMRRMERIRGEKLLPLLSSPLFGSSPSFMDIVIDF